MERFPPYFKQFFFRLKNVLGRVECAATNQRKNGYGSSKEKEEQITLRNAQIPPFA
jgi:hypothetical protein